MMPPCCSGLHQEDVESKNQINFKFQKKQPKFEVGFKILIHYSTCYLRALVCFCFVFPKLLGLEYSVWLLEGTQQIFVMHA